MNGVELLTYAFAMLVIAFFGQQHRLRKLARRVAWLEAGAVVTLTSPDELAKFRPGMAVRVSGGDGA
jgi:hypothetical protein